MFAQTTTSPRRVSHSTLPAANLSISPNNVAAGGVNCASGKSGKTLKPFDSGEVKILLLENVNLSGREILEREGYQVEALKTSLPEAELIEKIR